MTSENGGERNGGLGIAPHVVEAALNHERNNQRRRGSL